MPFNRLREVRREHRHHHDHYSLNPVHAPAISDRAHLVGIRRAVYLQSFENYVKVNRFREGSVFLSIFVEELHTVSVKVKFSISSHWKLTFLLH